MNGKKGFSLIEVVIFCFIAITLLTLFIGLAVNSKEFARTIGCVNNMKNIAQAVENFQADHRTTPQNLQDLLAKGYIQNSKMLKCPADKSEDENSYDKFYIGRFIASEKSNNVFLVCPRHHRKNKTVAAYLSYAVDIGKNRNVFWGGAPAEFGEVYTGGALTFADGTKAEILEGSAGLAASFVDNTDKTYSIIYTPTGEAGKIQVTHDGESKFEVITPAVIAGVEGTRFTVANIFDSLDKKHSTKVDVTGGSVYVEDRSKDVTPIDVPEGKDLIATVTTIEDTDTTAASTEPFFPHWKRIPRKPKPYRGFGWWWPY